MTEPKPGSPQAGAVESKNVNLTKEQKLARLFEIVRHKISTSDYSFDLMEEQVNLRKEIQPDNEIYKSVDEVWGLVGEMDRKIEVFEKDMGTTINFFDAETLRVILESMSGICKSNLAFFIEEIDKKPELDSSAAFWILRYAKTGNTNSVEYNWPIKADFMHLFGHRLMPRFFLNQIKQSGIELSKSDEVVVLKAFTFNTDGGSSIYTQTSKELYKLIQDEQDKALADFFSLSNSEAISKVAKEIYEKLRLMIWFRYEDKDIPSTVNQTLLDVEVKDTIRSMQKKDEHANFLGHIFPYICDDLKKFEEKKKS
jgi:hypothetical protein